MDLLSEGRAALDCGAWESAREKFEAALAQEESPEALEGLGWALFWQDRTQEGLALRERAFRLHRERGDTRAAARLACGLAVDGIDFHGAGQAAAWLERARRLLEGLAPGPEHGWVALWEGHFALLVDQDAQKARVRTQEALELARAHGLSELDTLATALDGLVLVAEGRVAEGMPRLDQAAAAALAGEVSDLDSVGATCCFLVHACERVRDYDRASRWSERVERFGREWGIVPALTVCRTQYAAMLLGRGDWGAAESELQRVIDRLSASRPLLAVEGVEQLAELRRRQGRWEEAEALFARAESRSMSLLGRAALAHDRGDAAAAVDLLDRFLRRTPPDNWNGRATALGLLVVSNLALGRSEGAETALVLLRDLAARVATPTIRAEAALGEGHWAEATGAWDEARRRLEDAVDVFLAAPAPFEAARARLDLARVLARSGRPEAAQGEARSACEALRALGAAWEAGRAASALEELQSDTPAGTPPEPGTHDNRLSPREIEVLRLVAEGLADKEIADRLHLSSHTVHRHVSNVRRKLGLPSRAAAVARAAQMGLL